MEEMDHQLTMDSGHGEDLDSIHNLMPEIYDFQLMPSDLQNAFTEILKDVNVSQVFNVFSEYIGSNIEPLGWKAVWKPISSEYPACASFTVNVVDVFYKNLEANVVIMEMIYPKTENLINTKHEKVLTLLQKNEVFSVPLVDLFVIESQEDDIDYTNTAYLIYLTRFFYKNIWRPWDDLDEIGAKEDFCTTRLIPRLNLLWDMKNRIVSDKYIKRFNSLLIEAFNIKEKIIQLDCDFVQNCSNVEAGDFSENYATESDALEFIRLKMKLQSLEREVKIIEDPNMRSIYHTLMPNSCIEDSEQTGPTVHYVSHNFTTKSLYTFINQNSDLLEENKHSDWPLKIHSTLQNAIIAAKFGDAIYLSPGIYDQPLSWIEKDIDIIGTGDNVELLSNEESGDVFLFINCESSVKLSNLTIRANRHLNHLIIVKSGRLVLDKCTIDCKLTLREPILVVANNQASIEVTKDTQLLNKPE